MLICTRGSQLDVAQFGECVREGCRVDDTLLEHATVVGSDCEDGVIPNDGFCEPKCEVGYQSKKENNFVLCAKSELNFEMFACVATTPAHALAPAPAPAPALAPSPTSILCNASAVNQKPHDLHGQPGACTEVVLAINATCALECDSGYTLGNESTGIRTCNVDGTTSDDLSCVTDNKPALTPAPAPAPAPVVAPALAPSPISNICNAFAVNQKPHDPHGQPGACTGVVLAIDDACALDCDPGYTLGSESTGMRTCNADGTTSDNLSCVALECDATFPPVGGNVGDCVGVLKAGDSCQPRCNEGFSPSGTRICSQMGTLEDTFECTELTPDSPDNQGGGEAGSGGNDINDDNNQDNGNSPDTDPGANCASLNDCAICSAAEACVWTQTDYVMYVATQCESKREVASSGNSPITCSEQVDNFYRILGGGVFAVVVMFILVRRFKGEGLAGSQGRASDRKGAVQLRTEDSANSKSIDDGFDVESWGGQVDGGDDGDDLGDLGDWDAFSDDDVFPDSSGGAGRKKASAPVPATVEMTERSSKAVRKVKVNNRQPRKPKAKASLVKQLRERGLSLVEARKASVAVNNNGLEAALSWALDQGYGGGGLSSSSRSSVRQDTPSKPTKVKLNLRGKVRKSGGKKKKRSAKKTSNISLGVSTESPVAAEDLEPVLAPEPSKLPSPAVSAVGREGPGKPGKSSRSKRAATAPVQAQNDIFDVRFEWNPVEKCAHLLYTPLCFFLLLFAFSACGTHISPFLLVPLLPMHIFSFPLHIILHSHAHIRHSFLAWRPNLHSMLLPY
jgi:hypothetical protein